MIRAIDRGNNAETQVTVLGHKCVVIVDPKDVDCNRCMFNKYGQMCKDYNTKYGSICKTGEVLRPDSPWE
jgi:hypothetical protein